jgi:uncharacterized membrane protein YphA (DoxX/SURF4 family)
MTTPLATIGRVLLGGCLAAVGVWYALYQELLASDFSTLGIPYIFIWVSALVYLVAGAGVAIGVRAMECALVLIAWLVLTSLVLHHNFYVGSLGDYPNFKASLVNAAIIGGLLLLIGSLKQQLPSFLNSERLTSEGMLLTGRLILGGYFFINATWQWLYIDDRMAHVEVSGGDPNSVWFAIVAQFIGAVLILLRQPILVYLGVVLLAIPLVASTLMVHGNLGPDAPYPPYAQVNQWFVKSSILFGLVILAGLQGKIKES